MFPEDVGEFVRTSILAAHLERLSPAHRDAFAQAVAERVRLPLDYVRLNVSARAPGAHNLGRGDTNRRHMPGAPFSALSPRSANSMREPATSAARRNVASVPFIAGSAHALDQLDVVLMA